MRLTVKDIKKLWDNGQAELVAGEKGWTVLWWYMT